MSLLDDAFELLETATKLEKSGENRIEAATKYFEAVYLIRQVLSRTPQEQVDTRNLLEDRVKFYSETASRLYFDDSSTAPSKVSNDPRSPVSQLSFFPEDLSEQHERVARNMESSRFTQTAELNKIVCHANSKLEKAIELDEKRDKAGAIESYVFAAESFLAAIRSCEENRGAHLSIQDVLKRRLEGTLDRIERLKKGTVTKNTKSQASSKNLHLRSKSTLSTEEVDVLKRSSLIASGLFLPWSEKDATALSSNVQKVTKPRSLFVDKDGDLQLSQKQRARFYKWARPGEIARMRNDFGIRQISPTMIRNISPYSIRQQYVTDCSFIASLCICAAFERRFRKQLITPIIYPQDRNGMPTYNPEGKYIVKLWLNGVARQVTIDDRLPVDKNSNLLCSQTTGSREQLELWVPIIEKAYMKLCGGYDFPGSNSGVDLFSLTGWIPERIFFPRDTQNIRDFETAPERAWDRLFSANSFGDCLITASTTRDLTEDQAESLGLVTGHAYAVLSVFQARDGTRLLQMKNPWATKSWTGRFSPRDPISWQNYTLRAELGYNPDLASQKDDGVFWISWQDVLQYFQNIQLSWNPALFSHRVNTHRFWPGNQGPANDAFNVGENPQFVMVLSEEAIEEKATIWVLISRHVSKQEQEGAEINDFLTIHLLRNNKKRSILWYPHGKNSLVDGAYTNNPHVLVRYDVTRADDKYISLILSQHQKSQDLGYTLSCFCTEPFTLAPPRKALPYTYDLNGSWTAQNAAGPVGQDTFFQNPMFKLTIESDCELQVRCSTLKSIAVNVLLLHVQTDEGSDLRRLSRVSGKPVLDSGNYRHGFVVTPRTTIKAGVYTLFVSTFHAGKVGAFSIKLGASQRSGVVAEKVL